MFKVGQRVVCIKPHSQGAVIVGHQYIIESIQYCPKCGICSVDVGVKLFGDNVCSCGLEELSNVWFIYASLFAPIEEKSDTMVEDILKEIVELK